MMMADGLMGQKLRLGAAVRVTHDFGVRRQTKFSSEKKYVPCTDGYSIRIHP